MKLTDLALVFVAILLPIVIIVYVSTSFVIRAEREEMYYKNMITSAVTDATNAMKVVENEDSQIDYGYSGIVDNKVSINANIAVDTFFTSLFNNFGIKGNSASEKSLKSYIPALAIIDYDGIYIYSAEEINGEIEYVLKPKKYFTYTYYIEKSTNYIKEYTTETDINTANGGLIYQVTFTQDDYIFLNVYHVKSDGKIKKIEEEQMTYSFYLSDFANNRALIGSNNDLLKLGWRVTSSEIDMLIEQVVAVLQEKRKEVIAKICMEELSYAVNAHNYYARKTGVKYQFNFSIASDADWYDTVDGIGMVAVVQGISLGNRYLNYSAYSVSDLTSAKRYYLSDKMYKLKDDIEDIDIEQQLINYKYYHASNNCPIYKAYKKYIEMLKIDHIAPSFMYDKEEIAANGFHACFICKP